MLARVLFLSFLLPIARYSVAQTPTADFEIQANACQQEFLNLQNTSTNADTYAWDFCPDDIANFVSNNQAIDVSGLFSDQYGYAIVEDNGQWHAFLTSRFQDRLYRLDFGNSPANTPTIVNLNNPGNLLAAPEGIAFSKVSGSWYAFVGSLNSSQGIRRLDFGSSLTNTPTAIDIGNFGTSRTRSLKVIESNTDHILVLCDYSGNSITTINYRDSFDNSTTGFVSTTGVISGIANPFGIDLIRNGNDWLGLVASYNNNSLLQLNFGADIQSVPTVEATVSFTEIVKPTNIKVIYEAGSFFGLVSNETAAMTVVDFKNLNPANTPSIVPHVGLPALTWLDAVRVDGVDYVQGIGNLSTSIRNLIFESDCGASITFSTEPSPSELKYTSAGSKIIELQARNNSSSESSTHFETVIVTADIAPDIDFTTNGFVCENSLVEFTAINVSGGVASYDWSFGDTSVDSGPFVQHAYASSGIYTVRASANGSNGCVNAVNKSILIYTPPVPDFTMPGGTLCTNGEQNFVNVTTDSFDGNLSYQWFVDSESKGFTRDLTIVFTNTGIKSVRLETIIPGCTTTVTKVTSSVEAGPVTDFTITGKCLSETTTFTNTSSGDIAGYSWNFGNTETSTAENPSLIYATAGEYTISLESESTGGCVSLVTKPWKIYSLPQPNFTITLPPFSCVGLPVKFADTTPIPSDGAITQWLWNFDGTIVSDQQNPEHTYTDVADYSPSLTVTTDQGCATTTQQAVSIEVCPLAIASFIAPSTACLQQPIEIINTSSNTDTYSWDFCPNDFSTLSSAADLIAVAGLFSEFYAYRLVHSNDKWIGFLTSRSQNKLYRFDFNDGLESTPAVFDLGNVGGLLNEPEGIDLIENNGNWFGFVGSLSSGQGIVRLDFGTSLLNTPTATNLGNFGSSRSRSVKVIKQSNDFVLIIVDYGGNAIIRVNYRDSFSNDVTGFVANSGSISGALNPYAIDLVQVDFEWIGVLSSYNDNSLIQLKFGPDIMAIPTVVADHSLTGLAKPAGLKIVEEAGDFIVVVSNEQTAFQVLNFFDLNESTVPQEIGHASLPNFIGLDVVRTNGKDVVQGISALDNTLRLLSFEQNCGASISYAEQEKAPVMSYTTPGIKRVELTARVTSTGVVSLESKELTISTNVSPDFTFVMDESICVSSPVRFTANSEVPLASYQWTFGDGQIGSGVSTQHTYGVGEYITRLDVVADNSCTSFKADTIKIYVSPTSSFTPPSGLICTNNEFTFLNTTVDTFDSNLSYQWLIDDVPTSTERDLLYSFTTGGDKEITLQTSIPGCTSESIQLLPGVGEGPVVDFTIEGICLNENVQLTNTSVGDIASYAWDFGDGQSSTESSPEISYGSIGIYNISLETTGVNGCVSSKAVDHQIFSIPLTNFNTDLPPFSCNGTPTQFNDLTPPLVDSNLESWFWDFSDNGATANSQSPTYTYALSGNYDVTLTVTSDQGCSGQLMKSITISESPSPSIVNANACVDVGVEFTTTSVQPLVLWQWRIGDNFYFTENATHTFDESGDFSVNLVVTGENGCINSSSKDIFVPLPIELDFTSSKKCVDAEAQFVAITNAQEDLPSSYAWTLGGVEKQGQTITHSFASAGLFEVLLRVTSESGCVYALNKAQTILEKPLADFSFSPKSGPPPLSVQFTNASANASSYLWRFNDVANSTSTSVSPSFVFSEIGNFPVDLLALNEEGCEHTISKLITIALPLLFVSLDEFEVIQNQNGLLQLRVTVNNEGNVDLQNLPLAVSLNNGTELHETVPEILSGGESKTVVLATSISKTPGLQFLCLTLELDNNSVGATEELCITLEENTVFTAPHPSPAKDAVTFEWIAVEEENITLSVVNTVGKEMFSTTFQSQQGLNSHVLSTVLWQEGLYFVKVQSSGIEHTFRIIIVR